MSTQLAQNGNPKPDIAIPISKKAIKVKTV